MFESAELGQKLSAEEYKKTEPQIRAEMLDIQRSLKSAQLSVLVIISGVDGAGKGETVNLLHEWFDPRYLNAVAFGTPTDEESSRPEYWRFWRELPPKGRIGIFFGSWYTEPIVNRALKNINKQEFYREIQRINATEKMMADDGILIVKFWFHLSKEAQKKRLKKLESQPETEWRVTKTDWKNFKRYERFRDISGEAVAATDTPEAPWKIVEGADARWRTVMVTQYLLNQIRSKLTQSPGHQAEQMPKPERMPITILDKLDLNLKSEDDYKTQLLRCQGRLNKLFRQAKNKGIACALVFEGWDAAGKGSAIRRITPALDARDYQIIPVAAPTDEEKARHYLWRFWRWLPPKGKITIFDRSWYGRVLVERVEGFASAAEWQRAYAEINAFEEQLCSDGMLLIKYWLHIDQDEQLRRFKERETVPYKQFKITEEDYRNREKYPQYMIALNDMIGHTSTHYAPWSLIEANDKAFARIKILNIFCDRLEDRL